VPVTLDELLERGRERIERLAPAEAWAAALDGALIVDIRSDADREHTGVVPGSVHVPRTVLEWRLAPGSRWRNPHVAADRRLLLICDHGYSSSLAAATLVDLGLRAGDVVGGVEAWLAAGLPAVPPPSRRVPPALAGMDAPAP
jgi:rhodanese-related sulfurtransferase